MLVLSRKLGERVLVPRCGLSVTVVAIEGNVVRLGFTAPTEVGVYREEVWRRLHEGRGARDEGGVTTS
jgi:carbon storage regulator